MITNFNNIETILIPKRKVLFEKYSFEEELSGFLISELQSCEAIRKQNYGVKSFYFIKDNVVLFEFQKETSTEFMLWILCSKNMRNLFQRNKIKNKREAERFIEITLKNKYYFLKFPCYFCSKINLNGIAKFEKMFDDEF